MSLKRQISLQNKLVQLQQNNKIKGKITSPKMLFINNEAAAEQKDSVKQHKSSKVCVQSNEYINF